MTFKSRTSYRHERKFMPGEELTKPEQLTQAIRDCRWIFFGQGKYQKAYHAGWIGNFQFSHAMGCLERGLFRYANRNKEYPFVFKAEYDFLGDHPEAGGEWVASCPEIPNSIIHAFTKDAICSEAEKRAVEHTGQIHPRVQVSFVSPQPVNRGPVALLK